MLLLELLADWKENLPEGVEAEEQSEPPRVLWRLKSLRGLSHEVEQVFP